MVRSSEGNWHQGHTYIRICKFPSARYVRISYIIFGNLKKGKKVITPKLNRLYFKKLNTG